MSAKGWIRDPSPQAVGSAYARREQIAQMGDCEEIEVGVLEVLLWSGKRLRWLQAMGGVWRLVPQDTGEGAS